MKRFLVIAVLAAVLATLLASTALAAGPVLGRWAQGTTPQTGTCPMGGTCAGTGTCPMGGAAGAGMMGGRPAWAGQPDEVGTLLGMTGEQIQAERQSGKSLAQIAQAKGVGEQKLIDTILASKKGALQQAVTAGKLTQAQADAMLQNMQSMVKTMVERATTGPQGGQGMMGGRGMMGRGGMMGNRGMMGGQGVQGGTNF